MFQFPGLALTHQVINLVGYPIRKSSDHRIFAPPRSLSQLITSFIASESQGIPHTLLVTFFVNLNKLLSNSYQHVKEPIFTAWVKICGNKLYDSLSSPRGWFYLKLISDQ